MDESVDDAPKTFEGLYADMLENDYRIVTRKEIQPDGTAILFDFSKIEGESFRIIGTSARVEAVESLDDEFSLRLKTADNIRAFVRVRLPRPAVCASAADGKGDRVPVSMEWEERTRTLLLMYDSHAEAVHVTVRLDRSAGI